MADSKISSIKESNSDDVNEMKTCFIICPIGTEESPERKRSDALMNYILKPALESLNYRVFNAVDINESGGVTNQIIKSLQDSDMVIADLTDGNPNVLYELSLRHALGKPAIHVLDIDYNRDTPFDVSPNRYFSYSVRDISLIDSTRFDIREAVKNAETSYKKTSMADNPITSAIGIQNLQGSNKTVGDALKAMLSRIENIETYISRQSKSYSRSETKHFGPKEGDILNRDGRAYKVDRVSPDGNVRLIDMQDHTKYYMLKGSNAIFRMRPYISKKEYQTKEWAEAQEDLRLRQKELEEE